jgi:hypothetical protein
MDEIIIINKLLNLKIQIKNAKIQDNKIIRNIVRKAPAILVLIREYLSFNFLKISMIRPINTTGWIFVGNSPNNKSITTAIKIIVRIDNGPMKKTFLMYYIFFKIER